LKTFPMFPRFVLVIEIGVGSQTAVELKINSTMMM
jgi:hypothetical protein